MQLLGVVDSVLIHVAEVWAVQLVAVATSAGTGGTCSNGSGAETLHLGFLRRLLGGAAGNG